MRLLSFLLILFLLPSFALADGDFYKGWVYPGDTFTAKGELFAIGSGSSEYEVILERGLDKYLISYGSCKLSNDGLEKYCYTESDYVDCQNYDYDCPDNDDEPYEYWCCPYDVSNIKFDAGRALFGSYIVLSNVVPAVSISHSSEKSLLRLGEQSKVTITLKNTGEDTISGLLYQEVIPEGFKLVLSPDFVEKRGRLEATLSIPQGAEKKLTYTVKPLNYTSGSFTGNATYTYKGETKTVTANAFTINVPSPFIITHLLEPTSSAIDEKVTYTYTVKNNDGEYEMDAEVIFTGFNNILYMNDPPSQVVADGDAFTWTGSLDTGEQQEISFDVESGLSGTFPLCAETSMELNGERFSYTVQDTFSVTIQQMTPELRLSSNRIIGGGQHVLRVLLDNDPGNTDFFKVKGSMRATPENFFSREVPMAKDSIPTGEVSLLKEETFIAPAVETETKYTIHLDGSYQTTNGELFTFSKELPITVIPVSATYAITHALSKTTAVPGDEIEVTVKVKNNQEAYRTLSITESIPAGAVITGGSRQKEMSLERDETREAYTYTIAIPESYQSETFILTTQVFDQQDAATYTKGVEITVELPEQEELVEGVVTEESTQPTPAPVVEEKEEKNFFVKMIDAIGDFFSGLFGG
jgi:uncharacterized repeat protein (TIGR01451 family)